MNPALRVKHAHQASSHSPLTRRLRQTGSAQPPRVLPCRGARLLAKAMQNHSTHSNSIATGTYSQAPAWPCPRLHAYPRASRRAAVRAAVAPAGGRRSGPAAGGGGGGGRAAEDRGGRSAWKRDEDEWDDGGEAAGQSANARRLKMVGQRGGGRGQARGDRGQGGVGSADAFTWGGAKRRGHTASWS